MKLIFLVVGCFHKQPKLVLNTWFEWIVLHKHRILFVSLRLFPIKLEGSHSLLLLLLNPVRFHKLCLLNFPTGWLSIHQTSYILYFIPKRQTYDPFVVSTCSYSFWIQPTPLLFSPFLLKIGFALEHQLIFLVFWSHVFLFLVGDDPRSLYLHLIFSFFSNSIISPG